MKEPKPHGTVVDGDRIVNSNFRRVQADCCAVCKHKTTARGHDIFGPFHYCYLDAGLCANQDISQYVCDFFVRK